MSSVLTPVSGATKSSRMPVAVSIAILIVISLLLFVLQLRHFSPFLTDDAYISLRYSQRLLEGHGLTWNDGHPVEGYTNFLWVLLCSALGALGLSLPVAAHLLGITTTLSMLVAVVVYVYRNYPQHLRFLSALLSCCALVLSSPFSMWSLGGLEQPLLSCMLVWAAVLLLEDLERPGCSSSIRTFTIGILLGLACISRADAALFTAAFYAAAVIADGLKLRSMVRRAAILPVPILFFVGQVIFRKSYYHEWVPNTAFVKVAFTGHRIWTGMRYLYLALRMDAVFLVLAVLGGWALWRAGRRKTVTFLITIGLIWTAYIVIIGGDIFPAARHFEPLVSLFGFLVAGCGLLAVDAAGRWKAGILAGLLVGTALVATSDAMTDQEHWELEGESLGLFIHQAFGAQQPLLSSDAAGVVPFYAHVPALDPLGLNDYHIAHEASRVRGYGWVGHELGDGQYILDQKPDLLLFSSFEGDGPLFPADEQIVEDPRFGLYYQAIRLDTPEPNSIRALMYIRRIDGKLGVQVSGGTVTIPGYLETTDLANSIRLVNGAATLMIRAHGRAAYERIPVPAGTWAAQVKDGLAMQVVSGAQAAAGCAQCFKTSGEGVGIVVTNPHDTPVALGSITLRQR